MDSGTEQLDDLELRALLRQVASQVTGASLRLEHSWIVARAKLQVNPSTSTGDLAGSFLASLNRCYLEPASAILWFIDKVLDSRRGGQRQAEQFLRTLAERERIPMNGQRRCEAMDQLANTLTECALETALAASQVNDRR